MPPLQVRAPGAVSVAIVGSGPAAMYAADEVLTIPAARVRMYERLPQPGGLARFGVAPDHRRTRAVSRQFDTITADPRLELVTGVEIGTDITHQQLLREHDAVIYAVGASTDRPLEVPGADLYRREGGLTLRTGHVNLVLGEPLRLQPSRGTKIGRAHV